MKEYILAIIVFVILLPIIFLCALIYHNNFDVMKRVIHLDFKNISKIELWMSFFISMFISAIISYSLI
jgi:hypothetical protein